MTLSDGTGVVSGFYWAYCNHCEWKSPSFYTHAEAERARLEHAVSQDHVTLAAGREMTDD